MFYPPPLTATSTIEEQQLNSPLNPWRVPKEVLNCQVLGGGH